MGSFLGGERGLFRPTVKEDEADSTLVLKNPSQPTAPAAHTQGNGPGPRSAGPESPAKRGVAQP